MNLKQGYFLGFKDLIILSLLFLLGYIYFLEPKISKLDTISKFCSIEVLNKSDKRIRLIVSSNNRESAISKENNLPYAMELKGNTSAPYRFNNYECEGIQSLPPNEYFVISAVSDDQLIGSLLIKGSIFIDKKIIVTNDHVTFDTSK